MRTSLRLLPSSAILLGLIAVAGAACSDTVDPMTEDGGDGPGEPGSDAGSGGVARYTLGGEVVGSTGPLSLREGARSLSVAADGPFRFEQQYATGYEYSVQVTQHPPAQRCTVIDGAGVVGTADVDGIRVSCEQAYAIGGTVSGLSGTLVLANGDRGVAVVQADGAFEFPVGEVAGQAYDIVVQAQPAGQSCVIENGQGIMPAAPVTSIEVTCRDLKIAIDEIHAKPASGVPGDANGDGVRDGNGDEFIELYNLDDGPADLAGLQIMTGTSSTPRFIFPVESVLPPGGRAVVFGRGTPTGSFGDALVFSSNNLQLTDAPSNELSVRLVAGSRVLDETTYVGDFGTASRTRSPQGTGPFVAHTDVSGSPRILWSPGVAPDKAIPKLARAASSPQHEQTGVAVGQTVTLRFNMGMSTAELTAGNVRLFASTCANPSSPVNAAVSVAADTSTVTLLPNEGLRYDTDYCVVLSNLRSAAGTPLDPTMAQLAFSTQTAASTPASSVVISQVGGARFGTAGGGFPANSEFVELYNPTNAAVDLSGWFLQRRTGGGTASCWATLPAGTRIEARGFLLIGGAGYDASNYGGVEADVLGGGTTLTGTSESVLLGSGNTCTSPTAVIDSVAYGTITDGFPNLALPPLAESPGNGSAVVRKACFDSTAGTGSTGVVPPGGHAGRGRGQKSGSSSSDLLRITLAPKNSSSPAEAPSCTQ